MLYYTFIAFDFNNLSNYNSISKNYQVPAQQFPNTIFRLKNCYECFVYKGGMMYDYNNYIVAGIIDPNDTTEKVIN